MKKSLQLFGFLYLSYAVGTWLRMFSPSLALATWADLPGKPASVWLGHLLFYPVFELLTAWPVYAAGGLCYALFYPLFGWSSKLRATLLGLVIGTGLAMACSQPFWHLAQYQPVAVMLASGASSGALFGAGYHFSSGPAHPASSSQGL